MSVPDAVRTQARGWRTCRVNPAAVAAGDVSVVVRLVLHDAVVVVVFPDGCEGAQR